MARFEIKSKDGLSVRFSGKPVYNGSYLKPSSLTFSEVNSPTPIAWEVGDYVDYTRTGMRYYLYSVPQPSKNANRGTRGDAFSYSGVQFFAATKELEIALFKDLVTSDNNIHFSTNPDVSTFENVEGIARRIQACMDYFYPNRWEIRMAEFDAEADAEVIEKISTAKEFELSGGTCLDALSRIYELWQDIGWIHTHEDGKEVIIIGYPNKRVDANTTDSFVYGKGNGLTAIKKSQTNKDEFATRLYVYGSERNIPSRYYNRKDILNAESVDIRNLMLPLDKWGVTDGKPDARKAYLENAEAVAKYGLIPKTHYFDSEDAGADIYPSISGMTIGMIRKALSDMAESNSPYYPSVDLYPNANQRVDVVRWCDNPDDQGDLEDVILNSESSFFEGERGTVEMRPMSINVIDDRLIASNVFSYTESRTCKARFSADYSGYIEDEGFESVIIKVRLSDSEDGTSGAVASSSAVLENGRWHFYLPTVEYDYNQIPKTEFLANVYLTIVVTKSSGSKAKSVSYVINTGFQTLGLYLIIDKTFTLGLNELGFDINKQASLGKGKVISMKTGACAGRNFVIESCRHQEATGSWDLTLKRQKDNSVKLLFPNVNYQIAEGDEFVLLDIAMPELYVRVAMERLLSEGEKLLARASKIQNHYEPYIDAKLMAEQGRSLREGMFMEITDADVIDNTTDYILIDTLSIYEDESAIPTYKVTLRERRKVTYKGTPSATSADNTESIEDDVQTETNIDLSEYAKKAEVKEVSELLSSMWQLEGDTIVATKDVRIKANLIVEQDTSSGGEGQDTPGAGLDEDEVLEIVKGYTYSKSEINKLIDDVNAGDIDLTNYYTKQEVDAKIPSLDGYATETWVTNKNYLSSITKTMVTDALGYIPLSTLGGTITGQLNVGNINGYTPITSGNIGSQSVNKANILATARTLWGNSFDGSKDISGHITLGNEVALKCKTTDGTARNAILINAANHLFVGSEMAGIGDTYITGNSIYFRYGANKTVGMKLNSSGYLGVNTTNPVYNLDVNGTARFSDAVTMSSTFTAVGGTISGQLNVSNINGYTPITSGNIANQSVASAKSLIASNGLTFADFTSSTVNIGAGTYSNYQTHIYGNAIRLRYGNNGEIGLILNSSGNITVGTNTDIASTDYQLYVYGKMRVREQALVGSLKIGTPSDNYNATLKMDGSSLSIDKELKLLAGGTADICPSIAASFKAKIAQIQNLVANNVIIGAEKGATASNLAFNVQKYTSVSNTAPAGLATLFSIETGGKATFNGDVVVNGNLIVNGDTSSGGSGQDTPASGTVTGIKVNGIAYEPTNGIVTLPNYPSSLAWSAITSKPTTLAGYGITDGLTASALAGYMPTSGGTFSGEITAFNLAISNTGTGYHLQFKRGGGNIIWCPSGGYYRIVCNGGGTSDGDATLLIKSGTVSVKGNLSASGTVSQGSDIRFKDIIEHNTLKIEDIANAPCFSFKWNDRDDDSIYLGTSAQYWEKVTPWLVKGEDFKTLDYSTLGVAMGISLAKKAVNHEERIKALEKEIKRLKEEMIHG